MGFTVDLTGKRAFITGGSRGVGRAIAVLLAQAGAQVGFCYHTSEPAALETLHLMTQVGIPGWAYAADLASKRAIQNLFTHLDREWPEGLDIFVANAGIWPPEALPVESMSFAQWRQTLAVNLDAVFLCTREMGRRLHTGGRIVYIGSRAGHRGEPFHVDYTASKGAMAAMVKGLCIEFALREITVNYVAPGWIDTQLVASAYVGAGRQSIEQSIPLGRIASPEDVAAPVVFLCSDLARHITGTILNIDGGVL